MYGKVFESIYESTVADDWRALVTMQQLITLADHKGHVHHSLKGLHRRTGIPLDVLKPGIEILLSEDPNSQSKTENGRRIIPLPEEDGRQPIGWLLVNYDYYKQLGSRYESKEKTRQRVERHRAKKKNEALPVTPGNGSNGYTDTDTDTDTDTEKKKRIKTHGICLDELPPQIKPDIAVAFIEHRIKLRKPLTQRAFDLSIKKAMKGIEVGLDPNEVIDTTIEAGWLGINAEWVKNRFKKNNRDEVSNRPRKPLT